VPDLTQLLTLQALDTTLTQLHHRRSHLPEHVARTEADAAIAKLMADSAADRQAASGLQERMTALEHHVHEYDHRIEQLTAQMYSDAARSPRDLQAIEHDLASIRTKRSELEDVELALIDELEPFETRLSQVDAQISEQRIRIEELDTAIVAAQRAIDDQAAAAVVQRQEVVAQMDASLLATYEQVRSANRGIGAARLEHGTCGSCKLKIAAVELDRIRHLADDVLVRCDECGAILVR
jgi:uncharacterized protein